MTGDKQDMGLLPAGSCQSRVLTGGLSGGGGWPCGQKPPRGKQSPLCTRTRPLWLLSTLKLAGPPCMGVQVGHCSRGCESSGQWSCYTRHLPKARIGAPPQVLASTWSNAPSHAPPQPQGMKLDSSAPGPHHGSQLGSHFPCKLCAPAASALPIGTLVTPC